MPDPWREHPNDPWAEADRLGVTTICQRLGWSKRRLDNELGRVASPEAFLDRVMKNARELDRPRLLHRDPSKPPTDNPAMAIRETPGEPAELVPEWFENQLAKENRAKDEDRRMAHNQERKKQPLDRRLVLVLAESKNKGIDIGNFEKAMERQIERIEKRLDRVA